MKKLKISFNHIICVSILISGAVLSTQAYAEARQEIWECNTGFEYYEGVEHQLWLVKGTKESYVKFYDSRISAKFYLYGLERRWDWEGGNFSVRLAPDNSAFYFDFNNVNPGDTTNAKNRFGCKKIKG